MKTTISLEDSLLDQTDALARDLGRSRDALIVAALREYLLRQKNTQISDQLNKAYANGASPEEQAVVHRLRTKMPAPDKWH